MIKIITYLRNIIVFLLILSLLPVAVGKSKKHKRSTAAPAAVQTIPSTGTAISDPELAAFDKKFMNFMRKWRIPGASVTIMKNGQVIASRGYGWADKEGGQQVTPDSLFRIASLSKTFTAVTVLKLVQDGKLKLSDPVFTVLNDLKPLNNREPHAQIYQITVEDLLQMSSGWFRGGSGHLDPMFGPWPKYISDALNPELPASCETTARFMMAMPLRYKPGTSYAYSNLDYCLLGLLINKVTGSRYGYLGYENYVKNQILLPIGISDMRIGSTQQQYRAPNEVHYYSGARPNPNELDNLAYLPYSDLEILKKNFANGGWLATSKDLATFIQAVSRGQILNKSMLQTMQTKPPFVSAKKSTYYTMGGIIDNRNGQRYWIQTGSFTGTNALVVTKPDGVTIAVVFNYRPDAYSLFSRFRPELRALLINSNF